MTNQQRINELNTKIKNLEDKLEHCATLPDELEILLQLDELYKESFYNPFLEKQ